MAKVYLFSDLAYALGFFASTERLYIVPEGFFDFSKLTIEIPIELTNPTPSWDESARKTYLERATFKRSFRRLKMVLGQESCLCYESDGDHFTTLNRFLVFLSKIGLVYRPELGLPAVSSKGVRIEDCAYFCQEVIRKNNQSFHAYNLSRYSAEGFIEIYRDIQ